MLVFAKKLFWKLINVHVIIFVVVVGEGQD